MPHNYIASYRGHQCQETQGFSVSEYAEPCDERTVSLLNADKRILCVKIWKARMWNFRVRLSNQSSLIFPDKTNPFLGEKPHLNHVQIVKIESYIGQNMLFLRLRYFIRLLL